MWSVEFFGAALQGYGPPAIVVLLWLRHHPELQMIALFSSLIGILGYFPAAFIFLGAGRTHPAAFVMPTIVVREVTRFLLCRLILAMERIFRSHAQTIHSSGFRLVTTGTAVGFGLGCTQILLKYGSVLDLFNRVSSEGATLYVTDVCPQLPFLYFLGLQANVVFVFEVAATSLALPAMAAMVRAGRYVVSDDEGRASDTSPSPPREGKHGAADGDGGKSERRPANSTEASAAAAREEAEANRMHEDEESNEGEFSLDNDPPPPATTLSVRDGVILAGLVVVSHLLFGGFSLLNDGATDWTSYTDTARGCSASLPLQWIVVIVVVAAAFVVCRLERVLKDSDTVADDPLTGRTDGSRVVLPPATDNEHGGGYSDAE